MLLKRVLFGYGMDFVASLFLNHHALLYEVVSNDVSYLPALGIFVPLANVH